MTDLLTEQLRDVREDARNALARLVVAEKAIAAHLAACEVRHTETQRRFDQADTTRTHLYAQMQAGFGELRGMFQTAHHDNRNSINRVERSGLERGLNFAAAILLAVLAAALAYALKK